MCCWPAPTRPKLACAAMRRTKCDRHADAREIGATSVRRERKSAERKAVLNRIMSIIFAGKIKLFLHRGRLLFLLSCHSLEIMAASAYTEPGRATVAIVPAAS